MKNFSGGIYPTMITPYKNGEIDYDTVKILVDWYIEKGCSGIFAVCQSSEMHYLSLDERVKLAKTVVKQANGRINVIASGHCGNSEEEQLEEAKRISAAGVDAFILISNRFDIHNDGDDVWLKNAESLVEKIDSNIDLGIYECPKPYKRLLTPRILKWCIDTGRFKFIKDTCCDPDMLTDRINMLRGSGCLLFNANGQTLLHSLKAGGAGYSGIMANFHPDILVWLYNNYKNKPEEAEKISNVLSMIAFTENDAYPGTAKYYLGMENIKMDIYSRSSDCKKVTPYQKLVMKQMYELNNGIREYLKNIGD